MSLALKTETHMDEVVKEGDPRRAQLKSIIAQHSLMRGDFTLSSGRKSSYLFQLRQTTMRPEGQFLIGSLISDFMQRNDIHSVGGLELGAVPIVTAVSFASHLHEAPVKAFFVRKKPKGHGAKELVDGELDPSQEILFVDDVTTTGASMLNAIDKVNETYNTALTVTRAVSIVDREEGATEFLAEHGIQLLPIFRKHEFEI